MPEKVRPTPNFTRFIDSVGDGDLLIPSLEAALLARGSDAWPEEFSIKVDNKERIYDGYFHPSTDARAPALLLYYLHHPELRQRVIVEREAPAGVRTLMMGSAVHAMMQSILIEMDLTKPEYIETPFVDKFRHCAGKIDVQRLINLPSGLEPPLEIKTIGWLPKEPLPEHVLQVQPYFDLGCVEPQPFGLILYIEKKHPHPWREFRIDRDEDVLRAIYRKWDAVRLAIEANDPSNLLDCPGCAKNNVTHASCPARNVCRMGPVTEHLVGGRTK